MATQTNSAAASDTPAGSKIDRYLGQQLNRTSQQVRLSDFVTGILAVVAFVLAFFFLAAIVDAWLWALTPLARAVALTLLAAGIGAIVWYALWPLTVRKINPQYTAKMIEDAQPGFKNSLLNYLELKRDKRPVHRAILNEVSKRAATDLSRVAIDSAVDKSNLIRIGFVLVGLVALSIGYLIFSPKSPFPTVRRVLNPGARIAKPAAVMIQNVMPKDTAVFFGDRLEITAQISGTHDADDVRILYSSQDAQIVEAVVPMRYSGASGIYSAILETGPAGIQQPLHYRIVARDGESPTYAIDVRPNPSISINSIAITPPKYTKLPARTIEGHGEIQAVEGSKIEIAATANLPIDVAYIVPLIAKDEAAENSEYRELRSIPMKSDGSQASGQFVAALNSNRSRPLFTNYKLKFRSTNDFQNDRANIYSIRVIADLAPEVEIVDPAQKEIIIPVNQPFPVEVWASDLDYEISSIDLHVDHQGTRILDRNLKLDVDGQNQGGRVVAGLQLTPAQLSLEPGDKAIIFATASDNRISPASNLPDPNISRTENYTLIVTDAIANPQQPKSPQQEQTSKQEKESAQNQRNPGESGSNEESQDETGGQPGDSEGNDANGDGESQSQERTDSPSADSGENTDSEGSETDEPGNDSQGSSQSGQSGQESDSKSGSESDSNPSEGAESGEKGGAASESGGNESGEDQSATSQSQDQDRSNPAGQQSGGTESGQDNGDQNQVSDGSTAASKGRESNGSNEQGSPTDQDGENTNGQAGGSEFRDEQLQNGESQPLDRNASDGERFERLKEYFEQQRKKPQSEPDGRASDQSDDQNAPELQDGGEQTKPADDANNKPANENESTDSDASTVDQPASQRSENSDRQPGNQEPKNNSSEQARDGQPDQPVPNGSESENGKPEASEQGAGAKSEKDREATKPTDSNSESTQNPESNPENRSESQSESSQPTEESESASEGMGTDQDRNQKPEAADPPSEPSISKENQSRNAPSSTGNSDSSEPTGDSSSNREPSSQPEGSQSADAENGADGQNSDSNSPRSDSGTQPGGDGGGVESQRNDKPLVEDNPNPDKANMDYAKKVTDLILDNLEDQQYEPDQELLDEMNWTQQDLENFLKSWQLMKNNAKTGDVKAQQEYVEALRSLSLNRDPKSRKVDTKKDNPFQLNEDGAVDQIPAEYVDPFNSYLKRRNRSKRN